MTELVLAASQGPRGRLPALAARDHDNVRHLRPLRILGTICRGHEIMSNRHERRKAAAITRKKPLNLHTATLDQHLNDMLCRARAAFERSGEIRPVFECVTDSEDFFVPAHWPDRSARGAVCAALRDSFRRRGVNRYVFASEAWVGITPGLLPSDDPARSEIVQVIAVERNRFRQYAFAEIRRNSGTATLGPWEVTGEFAPSWLFELLEEGHSDRPQKEEAPLPHLSPKDFRPLMGEDPTSGTELCESLEIYDQLGDLLEAPILSIESDPVGTFLALESELRRIAHDIRGVTLCLKDHPDKFPMFPTVRGSVLPSIEHRHRCKGSLQRFICEKRKAGAADSALASAFVNMYLHVGSHIIGALELAERIGAWDPEHLAKLHQFGLRSSYELDDEEGQVFLAISADRYPVGVIGRRDTMGELFVSKMVVCPHNDFSSAVDDTKQNGLEVILGAEAEELLRRFEQAEGITPRTNKSKEIWEIENWGCDEWAEQTSAEMAFAKMMSLQYEPNISNPKGQVAGYRVRRAPNGLVLLATDSDEDIFVAVSRETKECYCVQGWLRGSEGKGPKFYQKSHWVIPPEALHPIETLPGKEGLLAIPDDLNDQPNDSD